MGTRWSLDYQRPTYIYRLYDEEDCLLYVGIGYDYGIRHSEHMQHQPWGHRIARIDAQLMRSRHEARLAESEAIRSECPKYNQRGGSYRPRPGGETPEERAAREEIMARREWESTAEIVYMLVANIEAARIDA